MPRTRLAAILFGVASCLALAGCGDDDAPSHGIKVDPLKSAPRGDALLPGFRVRNGDVYTGRIEMTSRVTRTGDVGGKAIDDKREGRAVLEMIWTLTQGTADAPVGSTVTLRYVEAEGANAEAFLAREPVRGTLRHDANGRVIPRSLQVSGGTTADQIQAQDLIVSLRLAGFGGASPWTPARGIHVGEAWKLEEFTRPRALDSIRRYARDVGLKVPDPSFEGTARLVRIDAGEGDERWLELEIDAFIEIEGAIQKGGERGHIALGDRTRGTASVSAERGVPRSFDVTHTRRTDIRAGGSQTEDVHVRLRGTIVYTPAAK